AGRAGEEDDVALRPAAVGPRAAGRGERQGEYRGAERHEGPLREPLQGPPCIGRRGQATDTSKRGRAAWRPPFDDQVSEALRREVAVDVLVDPAVVRAEIAAPEAHRPLLGLDRVERPALVDVGRGGVL